MKEINPFNESVAGSNFVGREEQIHQFKLYLRGLKEHTPNHIFVAGVHGTGKTSYLKRLEEIAESEGFLAVTVPVNPDALARDQVCSIMISIIERIDKARGSALLSDWDRGKDSTLFRLPRIDALDNTRLRKDFETLRDLLMESGSLGMVVCLDEGQRLNSYALSALKNSLQLLNSFLVVLSLRLLTDTGGNVAEGRALLDAKAQEAEGDFGASRFYVSGIPIGPFDSTEEVSECIGRRLDGNAITFGADAIKAIGEITDRTPREIIRLSHEIYNRASVQNVTTVNLDLLNETFREKYQRELKDALYTSKMVSEQARQALKGLIAIGRKGSPSSVANQLFPDADEPTRSFVIAGIQGDLDRLCELSNICVKSDDSYEIPNAVIAYALKLVLASE